MSHITTLPFADRADAGHQLALALQGSADLGTDPLVLALPRGGVPVGAEVAQALHAELDLLLVRKIGAPADPELALGAIADPDARWLNQSLIEQLHVSPDQLQAEIQVQQRELERRKRVYRGERPPPTVTGRTVVLVDDGAATGATMHAAILALRALQPARIVVALPAAPIDVCARLEPEVDHLLCLQQPVLFGSVGTCYRRFDQTQDAEVQTLLEANRQRRMSAAA